MKDMQQSPPFRKVIYCDDSRLADVIATISHPILRMYAERLFEVCPEVCPTDFSLHKNARTSAEPYGVGLFVRDNAIRLRDCHPATCRPQEPAFRDFAQFPVRPGY